MMSLRILMIYLGIAGISPVWAFNCYFTLVKDSCWTKYNVSVDVSDAVTLNSIIKVTLPVGQSWVRQEFPCEIGQKLLYKARFSPTFWENNKEQSYSAKHFWALPNEVKPKETAWNVSVCYPSDFAGVPFPPDAIGNCKCDFSAVPSIEPK